MSITNFPAEINFIVFQYLPRVTLFECLFVCKSWSLSAAQLYYSEVILSNNVHKVLPGILQQPHGKRIGKWVRKLRIYQIHGNQRPLEEQEFIDLVSCMPHLKQIDLNCSNTVSHLKALWKMDSNLLRNMNEINVRNSGSHQLYTLINLKLCDTITHLRLENFHTEYFRGDKQRVVEYLSKFTSLEYLKIINDSRNGLAGLDMISIFSACPNLHSLDLRSYLPTSNYRNGNYTNIPLTIMTKQDTVVKNTKLHSLTLGIPDLTVDYFQYIAHHTPTSLKSFKLYTYDASFSDWVANTYRFELLKQFANHIKTYRNMKINMESSLTRSINQPLAGELLKKSITCLWDFLYLIKGNRDLFCSVVLDIDNFRLNHLKPYIYVQNNATLNVRSSLSYPQNSSDRKQLDWDSYFCLNLANATAGLPFINSLKIDYTLFYSMTTSCIAQLVRCLLSRCHWLQNLLLETNVSSLLFRPPSGSPRHDDGIGNTVSRKPMKTPCPLSKTQENLRLVILENISVSNRLLEIITTALPCLEVLKMSNCSFKNNSKSHNVTNIVLDKINHLPRLELVSADFDLIEGKPHICIMFESTGDIAIVYNYCGHECTFQTNVVHSPFVFPPQPEYATAVHIQCARIDTVSLYSPHDTVCPVLTMEPWIDFCLMSDQKEK
jgi:hypothetical protein